MDVTGNSGSGGAGDAGGADTEPVDTRALDAGQELRFEVINEAAGATTKVTLQLLHGTAELFGSELVGDRAYVLGPGSYGVFTWQGCQIRLTGAGVTATYVSRETPMRSVINCHAALAERRRAAAAAAATAAGAGAAGGGGGGGGAESQLPRGPHVLLVGPPDVGKSTVARILTNYAAREHATPLFVDLDPSDGTLLGVPGVIGAVAVDRALDVEGDAFGQLHPLAYHYGAFRAQENEKLYRLLVARLAEDLQQRSKVDAMGRHSGLIINLAGGVSRDIIDYVRAQLHVDVVLVIDHERLYNDLASSAAPTETVLKLTKSGGVVGRDAESRHAARTRALHTYFYGRPGAGTELSPHSFDVPFDVLRVWQIGAPAVPLACLPIGADASDVETQLVAVAPSRDLQHRVLGVSSAPRETGETAPEQVVTAPCVGYVCVQRIDEVRRTVTFLAPAPHPLPTTTLLTSAMLFKDGDA